MNGVEEDDVELVVAAGDAAEALKPTEEALDLVAASVAQGVVGPGPTPGRLGRHDGLIAELSGRSPGGVIFVGAVHDQGGATGHRTALARGVARQAGSVSTAEFIATGSASIGWVDSHANEPGLAPYSYMVRALRDGDQSQWSNLADVWVESPEPTLAPEPEPDPASLAPANLAAEIVDDEVRLSWHAPAQDAESVTGYEVERVFEPEPGITNVQAIPTGSVATVWTDHGASDPGRPTRTRCGRNAPTSGADGPRPSMSRSAPRA